ncbi:tetratricopeptide repeat protein [Noviherbaspirillum sp. 1P10PC]|jgi:predicted negative regulator of RcsB-dependent stress response|uniref:YfgM family protein n=1 Tax=Noviherbaspirillum sp. 1P10PC TaxID=3132292 RepID=UPI00399F3F38
MAYDLEEQEQIETLKSWWKQYGNLVTWLLIAALGAYAAWSGWNYYQRSQAAQAGQLYDEINRAVAAKDTARVLRGAADMREKFSRTAYAEMAALTAAKAAFDANDLNGAKAQLQWVVDSGRDEEYRALARIRLAGVLLDEKAYDEGLKVLSADVPVAFAGALADRRGDLLMAQNKVAEARAAYQEALQKSDAKSPGRQLIQLKLDAIGGAKAAA